MAEASTQSPSNVTVIGAEAEFRGQFTSRGATKILGLFEGDISSESEVHIGEGATCRATVQAARIIVEGSLEGDLTASDRVQLGARAQVRGDLIAGALIVSEGASFCGHCTVGPEIAAPQAAPERHPRIESRSVKPAASPAAARTRPLASAPAPAPAPASPAPAVQPGQDSLAAATLELENDPEWQTLSRA